MTCKIKKEYVWLSLGSNLLNPKQQIVKALKIISNIPYTKIIRHSSYYCSEPLGWKNQPDYINIAVKLNTYLSAELLLKYTQIIENIQGRIKLTNKYSPRTLDIDILLFNNKTINTPKLVIPHYDMHNRKFMIYPLFEIDKHLQLPKKNTIKFYFKHLHNHKTQIIKHLSI